MVDRAVEIYCSRRLLMVGMFVNTRKQYNNSKKRTMHSRTDRIFRPL